MAGEETRVGVRVEVTTQTADLDRLSVAVQQAAQKLQTQFGQATESVSRSAADSAGEVERRFGAVNERVTRSAAGVGAAYQRAGDRSAGAVRRQVDDMRRALQSLETAAAAPFEGMDGAVSAAIAKVQALIATLGDVPGAAAAAGGSEGGGGGGLDTVGGVTDVAAGVSDLHARYGAVALRLAAVSAAALGAAAAIKGIVGAAKDIALVNAEFQSLQASLVTVTKSEGAAAATFAALENLAGNTPFSVQELNEAFISLSSRGAPAGERALISFGNTASSMSKPLMQFVEAVNDAITGEFERLKEFGISAERDGERIRFTFQGISEEVENNAEAIGKYLQKIGDQNFAGAMERQMATLKGAISNAGDAWSRFLRELGEAGLNTAIDRAIRWFTRLVDKASEFIDSMDAIENRSSKSGMFAELETVNKRIAELKDQRQRFERAIAEDRTIPMGGREVFSPERMRQLLPFLDAQIRDMEQTALRLFKATERLPVVLQGQRVVPPGDPDPYGSIIETVSQSLDVDPNLIRAIMKAETGRLQGRARETAVSPKGAQGLMQIMPGTWKELAGELKKMGVIVSDPNNPAENIMVGALYLKQLLERFGKIDLVAAAYNSGPNRESLRQGKIPAIEETQTYVRRVVADYDRRSKDNGASRMAVGLGLAEAKQRETTKAEQRQDRERERENERLAREKESLDQDMAEAAESAHRTLVAEMEKRAELEREVAGVLVDILRATGRKEEAQKLEQQLRYQPLVEQLRAAGMDSGLATVTEMMGLEQRQFNAELISERLTRTLERLQQLLEAGQAGSPVQAPSAEWTANVGSAEQDLGALAQIAGDLQDPALKQSLEEMQSQFVGLQRETGGWNDVLQTAAQTGMNALADGITDVITRAEDMGEVFRAVASQVAGAVTQMLVKFAVLQGGAMIADSMGFGAVFRDTMGLAAKHNGGMVTQGGAGMRRSGPLRSNEIVTVLEVGEEVLTRDDPRHQRNLPAPWTGTDMLNLPNPWAGMDIQTLAAAPRYHDGGIVGSIANVASAATVAPTAQSPAAAPAAQSPAAAPSATQPIQLVVIDDQRSVGDWLTSSEGRRVLLAELQRSRGQVREILL